MTPLLNVDIDSIIGRISDDAIGLSGKKIIIAGGAGFLGQYWLEVFRGLNASVLESPCQVTIFDNFITGIEGKYDLEENISFIEHDVIEPLSESIDCDYIIHAAGIASPYYYRAHPLQTLEVSIMGTRNLLQLAQQKNAKFVFFSSSEIYGDPDAQHVPIQESYRGNVSTIGPRSCYDEGKRVGETLCYIFHEYFNVDTAIIRPFNIFGPGMREKDYRILPNFASCILSGKPVNVYGTGNQTRTYCYIEDAMVGFILTMLKSVPGNVYNIGTPEPEISVFGLLEQIGKAPGRPGKLPGNRQGWWWTI